MNVFLKPKVAHFVIFFFLFFLSPPFPPLNLLQLPSREQQWWAASQSKEKQEHLKQWQHQEGGREESFEFRGGPARDPATAQNPDQTSTCQVGFMGTQF